MAPSPPLPEATFSQSELDSRFEAAVLPYYRKFLIPRAYPLLILMAAQPGSGKTTSSDRLERLHGFEPKSVLRIDIDTFRKRHPAFNEICRADLLAMEKHTGTFAYECRRRMFALARERRAPLIVENSIANAEANIQLMLEFAESGYQVELYGMAVHSKDSSRGIFDRFITKEKDSPYKGRWVDLNTHNEAYAKLPGNFERLLATGIPKKYGIFTRDEAVLAEDVGENLPANVGAIIKKYRVETERRESARVRRDKWRTLQSVAENAHHMPEKIFEYMPPYIEEAELFLTSTPHVPDDGTQSGCVRAVTPHAISWICRAALSPTKNSLTCSRTCMRERIGIQRCLERDTLNAVSVVPHLRAVHNGPRCIGHGCAVIPVILRFLLVARLKADCHVANVPPSVSHRWWRRYGRDRWCCGVCRRGNALLVFCRRFRL